MIIGIPVYEKVDLLDVMGPYEMFQWISQSGPKVEVELISQTGGEVTSRDNGVTFKVDKCFDDVGQIDVLWVPGGDPSALAELMSGKDRRYVKFLTDQAGNARLVASVCEGALLLAAAGLLDGYLATTHWAFVPCLKKFPKVMVAEGHPRFVVDRNRVTGGGISSGLDEALKVIELLAGYKVAQSVQLTTQYYPDPPVAGTIPPITDCPFKW